MPFQKGRAKTGLEGRARLTRASSPDSRRSLTFGTVLLLGDLFPRKVIIQIPGRGGRRLGFRRRGPGLERICPYTIGESQRPDSLLKRLSASIADGGSRSHENPPVNVMGARAL